MAYTGEGVGGVKDKTQKVGRARCKFNGHQVMTMQWMTDATTISLEAAEVNTRNPH